MSVYAGAVDALAGLLDGPRAQGAFLLKAVLGPPWSLRIADEAPLAIFTLLTATPGWSIPARRPVHLGPRRHRVARGPTTTPSPTARRPRPNLFIGPGGDCRDADGRPPRRGHAARVRTWGNDPDGPTVLLTGSYLLTGEVGARLLRALPPVVVLRRADWDSPLVALLAAEMGKDEPGQEAVLDRLLDLLLITALRAWFARADATPPGLVRRERRPRRRPRAPAPAPQPGAPVDGRARWPRPPASPGRRWPAASPTWSANRRWPS